MNIHKIALLLILAATIAVSAYAPAMAEMRFGPWVYFAPYYFPPDRCCLGYCLTDQDFIPRYQNPNPLPPPKDGYCPPPKRSRAAKVSAARGPRVSESAPPRAIADSPRSGRLDRPRLVTPHVGPPPRLQGQPAALNTGIAPLSRFRPRPVASSPGLSAALPPQY